MRDRSITQFSLSFCFQSIHLLLVTVTVLCYDFNNFVSLHYLETLISYSYIYSQSDDKFIEADDVVL